MDKTTVYRTSSGIPLQSFYSPADRRSFATGLPADSVDARTGKKWRIRMYSGIGSGEEGNRRLRFLLDRGQDGLSIALDLPTQLGMDSDHPEARYDVGRLGVAIDSLADMETLFEGIPLKNLTCSFTINATANIILAMYLVTAEKQGVPIDEVRGTVQNDILKEYVSRGAYIYDVESGLRMACDIIEFCMQKAKRINAISIYGQHIRLAGAPYVDALAYMFGDAIAYVDHMRRRGHRFDDFARNLSFGLGADTDFFETIARYRACRRVWATLTGERFGAELERSKEFRFHGAADTRTLIAQQPLNNLARLAIQGLSNVLGGINSMTLQGYDEGFAIPTERAQELSLMIQHILAEEMGVAGLVDPLKGSYYVESLTDDVTERIWDRLREIEALGGMVRCIQNGTAQARIARGAYERERRLQNKEDILVGYNAYVLDEAGSDYEVESQQWDASLPDRQITRLNGVRRGRDGSAVTAALRRLEAAARDGENLMPPIIDAARLYATVGEMTATLKKVFPLYRDPGLTLRPT